MLEAALGYPVEVQSVDETGRRLVDVWYGFQQMSNYAADELP